jgi:hypothetical protein
VKRLHSAYFGVFRTVQEFHHTSSVPGDHTRLFAVRGGLHATTQVAESPSEQVFWYQRKVPKFTIYLPVYHVSTARAVEARRQIQLKEAENDPNRPVFVPATDTGGDNLRRALVDAI